MNFLLKFAKIIIQKNIKLTLCAQNISGTYWYLLCKICILCDILLFNDKLPGSVSLPVLWWVISKRNIGRKQQHGITSEKMILIWWYLLAFFDHIHHIPLTSCPTFAGDTSHLRQHTHIHTKWKALRGLLGNLYAFTIVICAAKMYGELLTAANKTGHPHAYFFSKDFSLFSL